MNVTPKESEEESTQLTADTGKTKVLNLDYKLAGLLCYLPICAINLVMSIIVMRTEPKSNRFLRFHAAQSLVLCVAMIATGLAVGIVTMVLGIIPLLGFVAGLISMAWWVVTLGYIYVCILGMLDAQKGEMTKLPIVGDIAEPYV
jgi:uncharacterized membrane protein